VLLEGVEVEVEVVVVEVDAAVDIGDSVRGS
jgi:hypothetical protein